MLLNRVVQVLKKYWCQVVVNKEVWVEEEQSAKIKYDTRLFSETSRLTCRSVGVNNAACFLQWQILNVLCFVCVFFKTTIKAFVPPMFPLLLLHFISVAIISISYSLKHNLRKAQNFSALCFSQKHRHVLLQMGPFLTLMGFMSNPVAKIPTY